MHFCFYYDKTTVLFHGFKLILCQCFSELQTLQATVKAMQEEQITIGYRGVKQEKQQRETKDGSIYLIIKAATDICTIYGGDKGEVLPVFPLKVFVVKVTRCTIP